MKTIQEYCAEAGLVVRGDRILDHNGNGYPWTNPLTKVFNAILEDAAVVCDKRKAYWDMNSMFDEDPEVAFNMAQGADSCADDIRLFKVEEPK